MAHQEAASADDRWEAAEPYERYVGRWSRLVATEFLRWLAAKPGASWADIGCGTGALTATILRDAEPAAVFAIDKSPGFVGTASAHISDPRVRFEVADATRLPLADASCQAAVSGLVLNFVGEPPAMLDEMTRITQRGGQVAAYVWDYAAGMQMMRHFWDAAVSLFGAAEVPDEAARFPICAPEPLRALWTAAGLAEVELHSFVVPTRFRDFDDYWQPFLGGQGPAPTWLAGLPAEQREAMRELLRRRLPISADGSIELTAAAWGVKGTVRAAQ